MSRGKFIVLEGIDGAGKTEQCRRLFNKITLPTFLDPVRYPMVFLTREPTTGGYGAIFSRLKTARDGQHKPPQEEFLMLTLLDRLEHSEKIRWRLDAGQHVICDRYESSTWAYQGACGVSDETLRATMPLARSVPRDLEILLELPTEAAMHRAMQRDDQHEWWSRKVEMLEAIQARYRDLGLVTVDASRSPDEVEDAIWALVAPVLGVPL